MAREMMQASQRGRPLAAPELNDEIRAMRDRDVLWVTIPEGVEVLAMRQLLRRYAKRAGFEIKFFYRPKRAMIGCIRFDPLPA